MQRLTAGTPAVQYFPVPSQEKAASPKSRLTFDTIYDTMLLCLSF